VEAALWVGCESAQLVVKVIASGVGGWQYLDIVSAQAGKLESLEYVRRDFGVALDRTVACGDSGNDTLMVGGDLQVESRSP
jgi:hydroxymethylpyrimidine pyrophosphatase-like HAD family hydrolase